MPDLLFQTLTITADLTIFVFVSFYMIKLANRERRLKQLEKEFEKKEAKVDNEYHHVVDMALAKERKILDDATTEADQIITGAQYIKQNSQQTVEKSLEKIVTEIKKDTAETGGHLSKDYEDSLKHLSDTSLKEFQEVTKGLQEGLRDQVKQFNDNLLPAIQKELEEYKQERIKQTEATVLRVVQCASQEVLNKSLSLEDHQKLVIESLEKAKKEGMFG